MRLKKLVEILKVYGNDGFISFDLGMLSKYNYYTGVIFKAYTYGLGDALVKGGRYDKLLKSFGAEKPAIGFMVVIDELMMALRGQNIDVDIKNEKTVIEYSDTDYFEAIEKAVGLRKEGKAAVLVKRS